MSYGVGCRRSSDSALLWLWHRLLAAAPIRPLAWEPPYATGAAPEKTKKKKRIPAQMYRASHNFISLAFPISLIGILQYTDTSCFYPAFRSITCYLHDLCFCTEFPFPSHYCQSDLSKIQIRMIILLDRPITSREERERPWL